MKVLNKNKITPVIEYKPVYNFPTKPLIPLYVNKTYEDSVKSLEKQITDSDLETLQTLINQEE